MPNRSLTSCLNQLVGKALVAIITKIFCFEIEKTYNRRSFSFSPTLTAYENGLTPNPDVLCNTYVKFSSFSKYVEQLGFKWMATGHYARKIHYSPNGDSRSEQPKLFLRCALDKCKDQTYFLAGINSNSIQRTLFPIGDMYKCDVKALAARLGLKDVAAQKESMGMCFVGKRKLSAFLREYTNASFYGRFTDVDSGKDIGFNDNALLLTIGQRARIPACTRSYYVVGKNMDDHVVFVARGADHPMLSCTIFGIAHPVWTSDECIQQLVNQECSDVAVRIRHRGTMAPCRLRLLQGDREHVSGCLAHDKPHHVIHLRNYTKNKHLQLGEKGIKATPSSSFLQHNLSPKSSFGARPSLQPLDQWNLDAAVQRNSHRLSAIVECKQPIRGVAPGQHAVFYTHDVCLGRGEISCVYYGSAKLPSISWSNREAITTKLHSLDCQ